MKTHGQLLIGLLLFFCVTCSSKESPVSSNNKDIANRTDIEAEPIEQATDTAPQGAIPGDRDTGTGLTSKPTGSICFDPLDTARPPQQRPPIGDVFLNDDERTKRKKRAKKVVVKVGDEEKTITTKKGAFFEGLALDEVHNVSMQSYWSSRPYFKYSIDFQKQNATSVCMYDNNLYGTTQISTRPRRSYCRKQMGSDTDTLSQRK